MPRVAIIGGGPAGLMAAEQLAAVDGIEITVFDAMPSVGRKFLMAGKGGMNITHAEPLVDFIRRYRDRAGWLKPCLEAFGPDQLRAWIAGLGIETFVGTSGRVFPAEMKAAPLLRAWLQRLRGHGVHFQVRHRWQGWDTDGRLKFDTPLGVRFLAPDATILALGGGSWPQLGSDGAWVALLQSRGLAIRALQPANCGFDVAWSDYFRERFAGEPVKAVIGSCGGQEQQGEFNITSDGIEGGLVYALSAPLRESLAELGQACLRLDLAPGRSLDRLTADLAQPRGRDSLANHLRRRAGISGVKAALLREFGRSELQGDASVLAHLIKGFPLPVRQPRPIAEAISSAGGVPRDLLDARLMLHRMPGVFCAGEMLDWDAPTGGYLLTACLSTGRAAGQGAADWLNGQLSPVSG